LFVWELGDRCLLGTPGAATAPIASFNPAQAVTIDVQRSESTCDEGTLFEAAWEERTTANGATRSRPRDCPDEGRHIAAVSAPKPASIHRGSTLMPIDDSIVDHSRRAIADRLLPHRHTALLVAIIALLGVRPLIRGAGAGSAVYSIMAMLLLIVALYTIQVDESLGDRELLPLHRKKRSVVGWALAIVAIVSRLSEIVSPYHLLATLSSLTALLFFGFVTINELRGVLKHKIVTRETISMSISVYLLLGLTWGLFYIVLFDLQPHAFNFGGPAPSDQQINPILIYFSLTTLATVGYGDITPLTLQARYASVAEGIAGQFYLAILVARLVGIQMSQSTSQRTATQDQDCGTEQSAGKH
jgi:hypothetical protein